VITGSDLPPNVAIDPSLYQAAYQRRTDQEMVEAKAGVSTPAISLVVAERVRRVRGMKRSDRIGPSLVQETLESGPALRLQQRIVGPGLGRVDVQISRDDVVVAGKDGRNARCVKLGRIGR
jgi:hypothetical protein